jgi:hypothetical protein
MASPQVEEGGTLKWMVDADTLTFQLGDWAWGK